MSIICLSSGFRSTPLAIPLLRYVSKDKRNLHMTSDSLNINIVLGADIYDREAKIITGNYGFQGYMGVPGLDGVDNASRVVAYNYNVSWGK